MAPARGLFDYVPPEDRSRWPRRIGFVFVAMLVVGGAIAAVGAVAHRGVLSGFVLFRASPLAIFGGILLWRLLRADPKRR